jgi:hypothetical protein
LCVEEHRVSHAASQQRVTMIPCQHLVSRDDRQICLLRPIPKIASIKNGGLSRPLKFFRNIVVDIFFNCRKKFFRKNTKRYMIADFIAEQNPPHPTLHPQARLKTSCTTCAFIYKLAIMFSLRIVIFGFHCICCIGKYLPLVFTETETLPRCTVLHNNKWHKNGKTTQIITRLTYNRESTRETQKLIANKRWCSKNVGKYKDAPFHFSCYLWSMVWSVNIDQGPPTVARSYRCHCANFALTRHTAVVYLAFSSF